MMIFKICAEILLVVSEDNMLEIANLRHFYELYSVQIYVVNKWKYVYRTLLLFFYFNLGRCVYVCVCACSCMCVCVSIFMVCLQQFSSP